MTETSATQPRNGRVVTFYSYKGGTGRTMALANVAWILAANGHRVLVADWDLESPGLYRFLYPFLDPAVGDAPGIIELVRDYEWVAAKSDEEGRLERHIAERTQVHRQAHALNWKFPGDGRLEFLSAGMQNRDYSSTLSALDWDKFYGRLNGGEFLDAMREDMKRHYDYVLIDSRTGFSDVADICTVHLPDILVDCFTLSTQGIQGAARMARQIEEQYEFRAIRVLPVPMRVDLGEQEKVNDSRLFASRLFEGLPAGMPDAERRAYWGNVEVPYRPFYAFEETLAVFGDTPGAPGSMLSSYERLTTYITDGAVTGLPTIDENLRSNTRLKFVRRQPLESNQITIEFLPEDQIWAEWIVAVLGEGGFSVREQRLEESGGEAPRDPESPRTLTLVSAAYIARHGRRGAQHDGEGRGRPAGPAGRVPGAFRVRSGFAVYVTPAHPLAEFSPASSVFLTGVQPDEAVERLQGLLGIPAVSEGRRTHAARFPGMEPRILRVDARNEGFTGREKDLRDLRDQLRYGSAIIRPVTLHGTGGVGKTQVALEYVHRFKSDYDLVWWINCGQPESIDTKVAELATQMRERLGISGPAGATVHEEARFVLDVLSQGERVPRWLLVYDNAEDIAAVRRYLPSSGGHVLITSQNAGWADEGARSLPVDLFKREESISHLRRVVPSLTDEEANDVAEALGDLPLAVATAAAYLKGSAYPVSEYLGRLQGEAPGAALAVGQLADYPQGVAAAWDPSLKLLQERSPAAARLLELCSVMAPEVALNLVYSPVMARTLEPYDHALAEPMIMGRVVQEISKLALLKLDPNTNQIQVHRLVQDVVRSGMSAQQLAGARADVQRILVAARPRREVDEPATWSRYRLLWPHLAPAQVVSSAEEAVRQLIVDRVRYIWVFSDFERGIAEARAAESRWEEMLAAEPDSSAAHALRTQLLQLRFNLGNILRSLSRYQEARQLNEKVLAEQTELLGADHPHTLMTAGGLAADLRALGHYRQALDMDRKTYPAWTVYGQDHRRTLSAANNLAASLRLTGAVTEALRVDIDTYERFRATLGPQNPLTLDTSSNVVRDLLEAGRYADAVSRMEDIWQTSVATLGINSPAALHGRMLLAIALRSAGRLMAAEEAFDAALNGLADRFGESSSDALACRLSRAANLLSLDRLEVAEADMRAVLAEYERRLGPGHPHALVCQVNLSSVLRLMAMPDEAMTAITTAMDGLEPSLGAQHPYTLAAEMVLGVLLADQGSMDESAKADTRTAAALAQTLGPAHPDTLRCRANLLLTRQQKGDRTAAAEREAVIEELEVLVGADHPTIEVLRGERRLLRALDPQPF